MATSPRLDEPNPSVGDDDRTPMPATLGDGRYEVRRRIGEGGFAYVYLAYDRNLDAEVAIKMLKSSASEVSPGIRQRFVREGRLMTRLRMKHPTLNIVHVTNVVDTKDECFYVMDVIRSDNAKDRLHKLMLRGKTVKPEQVLHVAIEVLKALVVLHAEGIVHCDIKPENVLIAPNKRILLMDFGTAHDDNFAMTKAGDKFVGTLAYMAPEVYESEDYTSEPRRDIYAVGALIYELATGKQPKRLDNCIYEQAKLLVLPIALRPIVLKATHRVADERYQTAQEMLDELEHVQKEIETSLEDMPADAPDLQPSFTPPSIDPAAVTEAGALPTPEPKPLPPPAKSQAQLARERLDKQFSEQTAKASPPGRRLARGLAVVAAAIGVISLVSWLMFGHDLPPEPAAETPQVTEIAVPSPAQPPPEQPKVVENPAAPEQKPETKPVAKIESPKAETPKTTKAAGQKASVAPTVVLPEPPQVTDPPPPAKPTLEHTPITSAKLGATLSIKARVAGAPDGAVGTLRFKAHNAASQQQMPMERQGDNFVATLNVTDEYLSGLDYQVEVQIGEERLRSAKPLKPHFVPVE